MSEARDPVQPTMEEILSSIRRIIAESEERATREDRSKAEGSDPTATKRGDGTEEEAQAQAKSVEDDSADTLELTQMVLEDGRVVDIRDFSLIDEEEEAIESDETGGSLSNPLEEERLWSEGEASPDEDAEPEMGEEVVDVESMAQDESSINDETGDDLEAAPEAINAEAEVLSEPDAVGSSEPQDEGEGSAQESPDDDAENGGASESLGSKILSFRPGKLGFLSRRGSRVRSEKPVEEGERGKDAPAVEETAEANTAEDVAGQVAVPDTTVEAVVEHNVAAIPLPDTPEAEEEIQDEAQAPETDLSQLQPETPDGPEIGDEAGEQKDVTGQVADSLDDGAEPEVAEVETGTVSQIGESRTAIEEEQPSYEAATLQIGERLIVETRMPDQGGGTAGGAKGQAGTEKTLNVAAIEELVRESIQQYLKTWCDKNMQELIERVMRDEIQAMIRRGSQGKD